MELVFGSNLANLTYILAGKKAFFHRYCDTGFKNKWTGLWAMPHKFLEYFAFKINGEWLSPKTTSIFSSDEIRASHEFNLTGLKTKEFLFVPENHKALACLLTLENLDPKDKKIPVEIEVAVNIREREENFHERKYSKNVSNGKVVVKSDKGCFTFGSMPKGSIVSEEAYKDHYPSGEQQRCFIPGIYRTEINLPGGEESGVVFVFGCGENEQEAIFNCEETERLFPQFFIVKKNVYSTLLLNSRFESGVDSLDKLFQLNVVAMEKLSFQSKLGSGYFAGYPWFTQFWGRDLGWMIPAVVDYGNFEDAKWSLRTMAKFQSKDGAIPNTVYMNGHIDYNSIDATPLWAIALEHYVMNSGDIDFLKEMKNNLDRAMEWCRAGDIDRDGFLEHGNFGKGTWMDTLDRGTKTIEVQAFWIEALRSVSNLYKILGELELSNSLMRVVLKLKSKFENTFWDESDGFYYDRITDNGGDKRKTINAVFPLLFGISTHPRTVLDKIHENFSSPSGVTTVSRHEKDFNPSGYHTGSSWGFTTLALACAEFANGRTEEGLKILNMMSKKMFENCIGSLGEVWNSETNELTGCCLQGWSSALAIRCIDEYFLGLKINALENSITVSPSILEGMYIQRIKRIGDDIVALRIERKNNKIKVDYISDKGKSYKLIIAPKMGLII